MFDYTILAFFIFLIILILLIIILIFYINNLNNPNNTNNNINTSNLISVMDDRFKPIKDLDIYFVVTNDKISQENLTTLSSLLYYSAYFNNDINYKFIKILNDNYDIATVNWYTKNIGIPKYFIFSLFLNKEKIFIKNNTENINICVSLLDKIFESEQNIRDELANGIDVISYNLTYIKLQKKYPEYLKEYNCHKDKEYMDKNYYILNKDFFIKKEFDEDGFYMDYSFIYHKTSPSNLAYLVVLLEDFSFLLKNRIYNLNKTNVNTIINSFKCFMNNRIIIPNAFGRGISRRRTRQNVCMMHEYFNILHPNSISKNDLNLIKYENVKLNKNSFNILTNYLMSINGLYLSYGKGYIDNYFITCLNSFITPESVKDINDGDLLNDVNINNNFNFQFGDEENDKIYRFFNNNNNDLKKNIILTSALLDENNNIIYNKGWLSSFIIDKTYNIEIILGNISNFLNFVYIIDRTYNIVTVIFYPKNKNIVKKICGLSVFSKFNITGGISESDQRKVEIFSDIETRYLYSNLKKEIINKNNYSYFHMYQVLLIIDNIDKLNNYYFMTINKNHKLPNLENTHDYIKYDNGKINFTLRKNIQKEEYNIISDKDYEVDKMFVLEINNKKILQYCNYPYYSTTPSSANGKNFIMDNQYRYYIDL